MFARWLRLIVVWSVVFSTFPAAAAVTAESWLTTGDETSKLARQPDLAFLPGNGVHPTRIQIDSSLRYQTMEGFGASLTDSSAWLLNNRLNPEQREAWLRSVFSKDDGIGISYVRQPMGASDFATQWYTYDDVPTGQTDPNLEHFSVAHDDAYIVPNLQRAMTLNPQLQVMASPWSPPAWMKTSGHLAGGSLKPEYHAAYADYFVRFIREYEARGIPIHAVTIQNEPQHTSSTYPTSRMEWSQQAEFIKNNLGPAFETEGIETKIVAWDHNWDNPSYPMSILSDPEANPYVAGTAWHAYAGDVSAQSVVHDAFPDKEIYFTEITGGAWWEDWSDNLVWGVRNIMIGATRNWAKTVTYWNLALDTDHGPHIGGCSNCRGVTTIHPQTGEFELTEEYYVIGHSSKFVDPGAYRIASDSFDGNIETVAYLNPDGSKVLVALNPSHSTRSFDVLDDGEYFFYTLPAQSVATFKVWQTLTWDGQGDGHWDDIDGGTGDSHWLDHAGAPVAEYPGSGTHAVLNENTVTVAADHSAHALSVDGGKLVVQPTASLSVSDRVDVAAAATLDVAGSLDADVLSTAGTNTIATGANISVASGLTLDSRLDMTGATLATVPRVTEIRVSQRGELITDNPLFGSELNVAGSVQTAGAAVDLLEITEGGSLATSAAISAENTRVTGGTLDFHQDAPLTTDQMNVSSGIVNLGADVNVRSLTATGGTINTGDNRILVSHQMQLHDGTFTIDENHTFAAKATQGTDLLAGNDVTVSGGQLTLSSAGRGVFSDAAGIWTFDNVVGNTVANEGTAGSDADGTLLGGVTTVPHGSGNALSLDGTSGQIVIPDLPDFEFPAEQSFTTSLWYRHDSSDDTNGLLTKGYDTPSRASNFYVMMINPSGQAQFQSRPTSAWNPTVLFANPNASITDDQWHQITLVRDSEANELRLHVDDGIPTIYAMGEGDSNGDWQMGVNDSPLVIGNHYSRYTPGMFDDVFIFNRPLDDEEVAGLWAFNSGLAPAASVEMPDTNLLVTADTDLNLDSLGDALLGDLALQGDVTLTVRGGPVRIADLLAGDHAAVDGSVAVRGNLSLCDALGTLSILGDLAFEDTATYTWGLGNPLSDLVAVSGELDLQAEWTLELADYGASRVDGDPIVFTYGDLAGGSIGDYAIDTDSVGEWIFVDGGPWLQNDAENHCVLLRGLVAVPEPGTVALLSTAGLALLGFGVWRRRWAHAGM